MPLVSVVLPTFRRADLLPGAIESIRAQTLTDWELIVVDDCSPDSTPEVVARYAAEDARIRLMRNEQNRRLPASLNQGFSHATGKYWTWTSDDNFYEPHALERMSNELENRPGIDFVYADMRAIDADGEVLRYIEVGEPDKLVPTNVVGACFMYRSELARKVGLYDPELFLAEDFDYWLRCHIHGKMGTIHQPLYRYRFHERSLTSEFDFDRRLKPLYEAIYKNIFDLYWIKERDRRYFANLAVPYYMQRGDVQALQRLVKYLGPRQPHLLLTRMKRPLLTAITGDTRWIGGNER